MQSVSANESKGSFAVAFFFWAFVLAPLALGSTISVNGPATAVVGQEVQAQVQITPLPQSQNLCYELGEKFFDFREAETSTAGTTVDDSLASGGEAKSGAAYSGVYQGSLPTGKEALYIWYRGRAADFCLKDATNKEIKWDWAKSSTEYAWRKFGPYSSADLQNGFIIMTGTLNADFTAGSLDAVIITTEAAYTPANSLPLGRPNTFTWAPKAADVGIRTFPVKVTAGGESAETTYELQISLPQVLVQAPARVAVGTTIGAAIELTPTVSWAQMRCELADRFYEYREAEYNAASSVEADASAFQGKARAGGKNAVLVELPLPADCAAIYIWYRGRAADFCLKDAANKEIKWDWAKSSTEYRWRKFGPYTSAELQNGFKIMVGTINSNYTKGYVDAILITTEAAYIPADALPLALPGDFSLQTDQDDLGIHTLSVKLFLNEELAVQTAHQVEVFQQRELSVSAPTDVFVGDTVTATLILTPSFTGDAVSYNFGDRFYEFQEAEYNAASKVEDDATASAGKAKYGVKYDTIATGILPVDCAAIYIWYRGRAANFCLKSADNKEKSWHWVRASVEYAWRRFGPYSSAELQNGFKIMLGDVNADYTRGYLDALLITTEASYTPPNTLPLEKPSTFIWQPQETDLGTKSIAVSAYSGDELLAETSYIVNVQDWALIVEAPGAVKFGEDAEVRLTLQPAYTGGNVSYKFGQRFFDFREAESWTGATVIADEAASAGEATQASSYNFVYAGGLPQAVDALYIWYRGRAADFCLKDATNKEIKWDWVRSTTEYTWHRWGPYSSADLQNGFIIMTGALNADFTAGSLDAVIITTEASHTPLNILPLEKPSAFVWQPQFEEVGTHAIAVSAWSGEKLLAEATYNVEVTMPEILVQGPGSVWVGEKTSLEILADPALKIWPLRYEFGELKHDFQITEAETNASGITADDPQASGGKAKAAGRYGIVYSCSLPESLEGIYIWYRGRAANFCLKSADNKEKSWHWVRASLEYAWRRFGPYSSAELQNGFMIMAGDLNAETDYAYVDAVALTQDAGYTPDNILPLPKPSVFQWIPQPEDVGAFTDNIRVFVNDELVYSRAYAVTVLPSRIKKVRVTDLTYQYLGTPPTGDGSYGGAESAGPHQFAEGALTDGDFTKPSAVREERYGASAGWGRGGENNLPVLFDLKQNYPLEYIHLVSHAPHNWSGIARVRVRYKEENGDWSGFMEAPWYGSPMPIIAGWYELDLPCQGITARYVELQLSRADPYWHFMSLTEVEFFRSAIPDAELSTVTADRDSQAADGRQKIKVTVQLKDATGPITEAQVELKKVADSGDLPFSQLLAITNAQGEAVFDITSKAAGAARLFASSGAVALADEVEITFTAVDVLPPDDAQFLSLTYLTHNPIYPLSGGDQAKTSLNFYLLEPALITVKIFDRQGRIAGYVCEHRPFDLGYNQLEWNGRLNGGALQRGVYLLELKAEGPERNATYKEVIGIW